MIVTNTEAIAGHKIVRILGLVQGNTVRAKHAGRDIAAGLKNLVGGELRGYTELLTESRRQAMERMLAQAQQLGANAVVNILCIRNGCCRRTQRLSLFSLKSLISFISLIFWRSRGSNHFKFDFVRSVFNLCIVTGGLWADHRRI